MKTIRPNTALIGIAGVHHVVAELSRRGLVALPTVRNTAGYDVIVVTRDGRKHANIQVKTSSKKCSFFRMPPSKDIKDGPRDFYVLLRWDQASDRYDVLMLTGREARQAVVEGERVQGRRIRSGSRAVLGAVCINHGRPFSTSISLASTMDRLEALRNAGLDAAYQAAPADAVDACAPRLMPNVSPQMTPSSR